MTGQSTKPPTTLGSAPSMPATTIITRAFKKFLVDCLLIDVIQPRRHRKGVLVGFPSSVPFQRLPQRLAGRTYRQKQQVYPGMPSSSSDCLTAIVRPKRVIACCGLNFFHRFIHVGGGTGCKEVGALLRGYAH